MKKIQLTQGQFALVDDEDYEYLSQWKWYAHRRGEKYTYYAMRTDYTKGKVQIRMHNAIALRYGLKDYEELDHADRNGLNNQKDNLRVCTRGENNFNRRKFGELPKGVRIHKKKHTKKDGGVIIYTSYQARINVNGKSVNLGLHKELKDAVKAYNDAALRYYPNFVYEEHTSVSQ